MQYKQAQLALLPCLSTLRLRGSVEVERVPAAPALVQGATSRCSGPVPLFDRRLNWFFRLAYLHLHHLHLCRHPVPVNLLRRPLPTPCDKQ
jgi:hypothetical protein